MSDHTPTPKPRYKLVYVELVCGDESNEVNEAALDTTAARIPQIADELQGVEASAEVVEREESLIDHDAVRDHEGEQRIADRARKPTEEIVKQARVRDHLRKAGKELNEAAILAAIKLHVHAEAAMREAIAAVHELWEKYVPATDEVVRDLIIKEAIKGAIWLTLVSMGVKLAS